MTGFIERLHIAHRLALRASQGEDIDAAAAVRAWPRVAQAALQANSILADSASSDDRVVERIALDAASLARSHSRQPWPGVGPRDQALLQVAAGLHAAAESAKSAPTDPDAVHEAQALIASSLWVTAQLISRAARDHSYDIRFDGTLNSAQRLSIGSLAMDTHRRLNAVEQLALSGMNHQPSRSDGGVAADLRQAVATWDVQAHRALLQHRSTMVLHILARQEALSVLVFHQFVDNAARTGIIDPFTRQRLTPALSALPASWKAVGDLASEFSFATTPVPRSFIHAAEDLRGRFQDAMSLATPDDHRDILDAMSGHLASSFTIAASTRDLIGDRELRGPARAIARVIAERNPEIKSALVDPVDIHRGVSVPLPEPARVLFEPLVQQCFLDANEMVNRAAGLDSLHRTRANAQAPETPGRSSDVPRPPQDPSQTPSPAPSR